MACEGCEVVRRLIEKIDVMIQAVENVDENIQKIQESCVLMDTKLNVLLLKAEAENCFLDVEEREYKYDTLNFGYSSGEK